MDEEAIRGSTSQCEKDLITDVEEYLIQNVDDGDQYFKSRFIATDLGVSPKKIGHLMREIQSQSTILKITDWGGNSDAITWHVDFSE